VRFEFSIGAYRTTPGNPRVFCMTSGGAVTVA
jgi:hypothetical protein